MKNKGSVGGLILIFIGVFWLMTSFGVITWSLFDVMFRLWPLILIVIGINTIFRNKDYIRYITWSILIIAVVLFGFYGQDRFRNDVVFETNPNLVEESHPEITSGKLRLQLGGGNIKIDSIEDKLIKARIPDSKVRKSVKFSSDNTRVDINIDQMSDFININNKKSFDYNFNLNENVLWNIDIDTGAINGTMDFSNLKISNLDIDMGVSNLNLIFGDKQDKAKVDIDGGISNLELTVPKNLGVRLDIDGGIKNTNISELGWKRMGDYYESPNYDETAKKLDIEVDTGIGKFDVRVK